MQDSRSFLFGPKLDLIQRAQHSHGILAFDEVAGRAFVEQGVVAFRISVPVPPLLLRHKDVGMRMAIRRSGIGNRSRQWSNVFEDVPWVEKLWVDVLRSDKLATYHKDFGRDVSKALLVRRS